MKSSDIPYFVDQLQNVTEPRCILVDGPWGCGKTTAVLKAVTGFENPDSDVPDGQMVIAREICYMSVYGFCSTKDMQRSLIEAQNKDARQIGEKAISVFRMVTPFVSAFSTAIFPPAVTIINPLLEKAPTIARKALKAITKKQKNDVIIIIDDLERLSPSIEYNEMLGLIDQLKKLGNSIVCLADSTHMGKRRKDWHLFLEKCFDRICEIEQTDEETLKNISGLSDDSYMSALQESIGKNYRLAERARMLKEDVMRVIKPEVSDQRPMMLSPDELLMDCVLCCRCVLDTLPKKKKERNQDPTVEAVLEAMETEKTVNAYGDKISSNLEYFFSRGEARIAHTDEASVRAILEFYLHNDMESIKNVLVYSEEVEVSPNHPFFFGDEKLKAVHDEFVRNVSNGTITDIDDCGLDYFLKMLSVYEGIFSSSEIDEYIEFLTDHDAVGQEALIRLKYSAHSDETSDHRYKNFYCKLFAALCAKRDLVLSKNICEAGLKRQYKLLAKYADEIERRKYTKVTVSSSVFAFEANDFFLPNLTGDILSEEWSFVHHICGLVQKNVFPKESFSESLDKQLDLDRTKCGERRILSLKEQYSLNADSTSPSV